MFRLTRVIPLLISLVAACGDSTPATDLATSQDASVDFAIPRDFGTPDLGAADLPSADLAAPVLFGKPTSFATGMGPRCLVKADFDRDGRLDLATVNGMSDDVGVLLGKGDGTFQPPAFYKAGQGAGCLYTADMNGDGAADLVTSNSGSVSVFLNEGNGTFKAAMETVTTMFSFLAVADFNGDGKQDLILSARDLYLGNGDGTFQPAMPVNWGMCCQQGVTYFPIGDRVAATHRRC